MYNIRPSKVKATLICLILTLYNNAIYVKKNVQTYLQVNHFKDTYAIKTTGCIIK